MVESGYLLITPPTAPPISATIAPTKLSKITTILRPKPTKNPKPPRNAVPKTIKTTAIINAPNMPVIKPAVAPRPAPPRAINPETRPAINGPIKGIHPRTIIVTKPRKTARPRLP